MDGIRDYLLKIVAAAILCGVAKLLTGNKGFLGTAIKMLTGLIMVLTALSPLLNLQLDSVQDLTAGIEADGRNYVDSGKKDTREAMAEIIKTQTEAYILDKAESLGISLTVDVILSEDDIPVPLAVTLCGNFSPYAKNNLSDVLADELGIPSEEQTWITPQ